MFELDPFQKRAIAAIEADKSVLVSAPTGAGKTVIAECAIERAFKNGQRAVYTGPIKALSNQKFRDFSERYPGQVGLMTGDVTLFPDSPLLIMTTEIYRNQVFEDPERLKNTHWVIFDEVHYLDDPERGTVWEEAIMFSPDHMRIVALSATAPNIEELAGWMRKILNHSIEVVIETHRPVPLHHYFQCQNKIFSDPRDLKKDGYLNRDRWPGGWQAAAHSNRHEKRRGGRSFESHLHAKPNRTEHLIHEIANDGKLPCLYFAFGRKRTEELAWEQAERFDFLDAQEREEVRKEYRDLCERFELGHEKIAADLERLVTRGIAFHHAGMLPPLKEVIERLFTNKRIHLIFTTETFAIGINMPAKTVVFDELRKFYGTHFGFLRTRDYFQMAGRAGRRGIDEEGLVISRVNPHLIPHSILMKIVYGKPEPIESQFNSCYATLINLYDQLGDKLIDVYPRSLHAYQADKHSQKKATDMIERKISLLKELGHFKDGKVTEKGNFASWMYGYELILAELLEEGALEYVDDAGLAVLLAALTYEPRRNQSEPDLPSDLMSVAKRADRAHDKIRQLESRFKVFPPTRPPAFHMALAVKAWTQGAPFTDMGRFTDIDEGEIIRHLRMVIQLLRQIQHAPLVSDRLRQAATSARKKINRDWVDAEKQLKNM